jgi:hypothetical protein
MAVGQSVYRGKWHPGIRKRAIRDACHAAMSRLLELSLPAAERRLQGKAISAFVKRHGMMYVYGYKVLGERLLKRSHRVTLQVYIERDMVLRAFRKVLLKASSKN